MRHNNRECSRREFGKMALGAVVPLSLFRTSGQEAQVDSLTTRLPNPRMAGRSRTRVSDYENDPFVVGVERKLRCTCGCNLDVYTCRTTDFTCEVSPAMHRQVIGLVEQDKSAQEILDAFVATHGEMVLMAPPREGFNYVGYLLPGTAIALIGSWMLWTLSRKTRRSLEPAAVKEGVAHADASLSSEDEQKLKAELAALDR